MKTRIDRLKRIENLQRRLHELSQWRLAALGQQRDRLAGAHGEMLGALSEGLLAAGAPAAAATRRIRALELEMAVAQTGYDTQAKLTLDFGARAHLADRALDAATVAHRQHAERKTLVELIERSLAVDGTGSRKA